MREGPEHRWPWQQEAEREPPDEAFGGRARPRCLDLRARAFHELAELHSGRARGLAGSAVEAAVHVALEWIAGDVDAPLPHRLHEPDAPARRINLHAEQRVRG